MKNPFRILLAIILMCQYANAQKSIDNLPKKDPANVEQPAPNKFSSAAILPIAIDKNILIKIYGKTEGDKKFEKYWSELNSFNANGDEVWIYEDAYFGGQKKVLKVGNYTLTGNNKTKVLGTDWNDKISSMLIPISIKMMIYRNDNFDGLKTELWGYGNLNRETNEKGFRGDYYTFDDLGRYSKGGVCFYDAKSQSNPSINANDEISSLKIYK